MTDGGIRTLSSRIAYENPWTRVREDIIERADGSPGLYGVVERGDFVVVLPLHANGDVTLVEQYRYPVRRRLIELPMGMWEHRPGTLAATVAAGELEEETGLAAGSMRHAGTILQGPGYSTQRGHVFLATDLRQGRPRRETSEQDMSVRRVALAAFQSMIAEGEIVDAITIAAFGLLKAKEFL